MSVYWMEFETPNGRKVEVDEAEDMNVMVAKIEEETEDKKGSKKGWRLAVIAMVDKDVYVPEEAKKFFK